MKKLFLDDIRIPKDAIGLVPSNLNQFYFENDWVVVRNFWEFNSYGFSTANEEVANQLIESKKVKLLHKSQIKETPLSEIVPLINPLEPSVLSIDVEGFEMAVLKSNNWDRFSPRVICIEEWELTVSAPTEIGRYLLGVGYKWKGWTGLTSFYVHTEYLTKIKTSVHHR